MHTDQGVLKYYDSLCTQFDLNFTARYVPRGGCSHPTRSYYEYRFYEAPTTLAPITPAPTTAPSTEAPITPAPTTAPSTEAPTTPAPTTTPSTEAPTTPAPTTTPSTEAPTTPAPTTTPATDAPNTPAPTVIPTTAPGGQKLQITFQMEGNPDTADLAKILAAFATALSLDIHIHIFFFL